MPAALKADVLRDICVEAARPIAAATKANARVRTGALQDSIIIKGVKFEKNGFGMALVGVDRGYFVGGRRIARAKVKDAKGVVDRPSKYAHLVEFGHVSRGGGFVAPRPFIRPGVIEGSPAAAVIISSSVNEKLLAARERAIKSGTHAA